MSKVVVLGAGQWGTTMAQVLCDAGNHVLMWGRSQELVDEVNNKHTNSKYLDENILPVGLKATTDLREAFEYSNIYVLAVPAQTLRENLTAWKSMVAPNALFISTLKGIEVSTMSRMTEIISEVMETENIAIITGPKLQLLESRKRFNNSLQHRITAYTHQSMYWGANLQVRLKVSSHWL